MNEMNIISQDKNKKGISSRWLEFSAFKSLSDGTGSRTEWVISVLIIL